MKNWKVYGTTDDGFYVFFIKNVGHNVELWSQNKFLKEFMYETQGSCTSDATWDLFIDRFNFANNF